MAPELLDARGSRLRPEGEGLLLGMPRGTGLLIVGNDAEVVEADLAAGEQACLYCQGELRPWGHARARMAKLLERGGRHRPRRGRC